MECVLSKTDKTIVEAPGVQSYLTIGQDKGATSLDRFWMST